MKKIVLALLFVVGFTLSGRAAEAQSCTTSPCNAVSANHDDVLAALPASGATGAFVVNIPSGTGTWTATINYPIPAGVTSLTIQGNTSVTCTGTAGTSSYACSAVDNTVLVDSYDAPNGPLMSIQVGTAAFRMTGLTFIGGTISSANHKPNGFLNFYGASTSFRIDHSHFNTNSYSVTNAGGGMTIFTNLHGVVDNSLFEMASQNNAIRVYAGSADYGDTNWSIPTDFGTSEFIFAENDEFKYGAANDCDAGGRMVIRYSTILADPGVSDTGLWQGHSMGQGQQRSRGCRALEIYHNYVLNAGSSIYADGDGGSGTGLLWNNSVSGYDNDVIFLNYREEATGHSQDDAPVGIGYCGTPSDGNASPWDGNSDPSTGYPCLDQTGRGQGDLLNGLNFPNALNTVTGTRSWAHNKREPWYVWSETMAHGTICSNPSYDGIAMLANRDFFCQVSSFDGTSGVGVGVLSARPTTCTAGPGGTYDTSPTGSYGVAYWATDANSGNGELYICTANTGGGVWTPVYQPYPYPHPLISGGGGGGTPTAATPIMSPSSGIPPKTVTMTCSTASPTIYYTTNGSTPTTGSTVYTTPISVSINPTTVKAICTASGFLQSGVASGTYSGSTTPPPPTNLGAVLAGQ